MAGIARRPETLRIVEIEPGFGLRAIASPRCVRTFPGSGMVYVIDLRARAVVGQVTGVGNDPYGLTIAE